ncbi:TRAP transporter small permease [Falsirhodobacter halotolerans]|uniref:TRAP transporter small permease n=1 Tax=Falsirhodobacter halotolerans TaxID=1146892 RepID=UPI001FD2754C|nr:TRAP transporter small permease [Falsirhodobacter halotolerans]MCJ8140960.1 TRAP transporter small permease [Falsirhodobacter halotolerans]
MSGARPNTTEWIEGAIRVISEISAWVYFLIGAIVTYEVVARYVFRSPTEWVEEMSRLGMVWATFLLLAICLQQRQLITITLLSNALGPRGRLRLEAAVFAVIAVIAGVVAVFSAGAVLTMMSMGRATASTLALPYWLFYLPIFVGFLLLCVQATLDFVLICRTGQRRNTHFGHEEI